MHLNAKMLQPEGSSVFISDDLHRAEAFGGLFFLLVVLWRISRSVALYRDITNVVLMARFSIGVRFLNFSMYPLISSMCLLAENAEVIK